MIRLLLIVVFVGILSVAPLFADTTWVNMGGVSGTWTPESSPYMIYQGDVSIISSQTLNIEAGVTVQFTGHYMFHVNGLLRALGTSSNPVLFTCDTTSNPDRWGGIRFTQCHDSTLLEYCIVENGNAQGMTPENQGGGIYCNNASLTIRHCTVRHNQAQLGGGIAFGNSSTPELITCEFRENYATYGGCVFSQSSSPSFRDCYFADSRAENTGGVLQCQYGVPAFQDCIFQNSNAREGGAIYCQSCSPVFTSCNFLENSSNTSGGVAKCVLQSSPEFTGCRFVANAATGSASNGGALYFLQNSNASFSECDIIANSAEFGGAVYVSSSDPSFEHCIFVGNSAGTDGGAVYVNLASPDFLQCTFFRNYAEDVGGQLYLVDYNGTLNTCIVANGSGGGGLYLRNSTYSVIRYNDIFGNDDGDLEFYQGNHIHGPSGLGFLTQTNANGDPCDPLQNIMMDPVFVNPSANNIFLQATSPCIDAGDPALPHDPNGSVADMGAYYYGQTPVASPSVASTPEAFRLLPCYPNPFNAVTVIPFELSSPGKVTLTVYDVLGRKVATLAARPMASGSYRIRWDAVNKPSGIYFVRLMIDEYEDVGKVILQK
jgi:predicted outer membrane repeat protein